MDLADQTVLKALPDEEIERRTRSMCAMAEERIQWKAYLTMMEPKRQEQENAAMKAATGITTDEAWDFYDLMLDMQGDEHGVFLTSEQAVGLAKWIALLSRSRQVLQERLERAEISLVLAGKLVQKLLEGSPVVMIEEEPKEKKEIPN